MQRPERVMVGLTENIQVCLRIFRRKQHQWLARDILHRAQGVFYVFVLLPDRGSRVQKFKGFKPFLMFLSYTQKEVQEVQVVQEFKKFSHVPSVVEKEKNS